jgi:hypothetical protein
MREHSRTLTALLCLCLALPLHAGRRRAVAPPAASLAIEFVEVPSADATLATSGSDAWIDLNTVSHLDHPNERTTRVRKRFGVRIVRPGGLVWGTAVVTARLAVLDPRAIVRIDGKPIGTAAVVVSTRVAVGTLAIHTLQIDVPTSASAGPLTASLAWEAVAQ